MFNLFGNVNLHYLILNLYFLICKCFKQWSKKMYSRRTLRANSFLNRRSVDKNLLRNFQTEKVFKLMNTCDKFKNQMEENFEDVIETVESIGSMSNDDLDKETIILQKEFNKFLRTIELAQDDLFSAMTSAIKSMSSKM